jgi:hypothetical protein
MNDVEQLLRLMPDMAVTLTLTGKPGVALPTGKAILAIPLAFAVAVRLWMPVLKRAAVVTLAPRTVLMVTYVTVCIFGRLLLTETWHRSTGAGPAAVLAAAVAAGAMNSAPAAAGAASAAIVSFTWRFISAPFTESPVLSTDSRFGGLYPADLRIHVRGHRDLAVPKERPCARTATLWPSRPASGESRPGQATQWPGQPEPSGNLTEHEIPFAPDLVVFNRF